MGATHYKAVQGHGEAFENLIKSAFPGASNFKRTPFEIFDIEEKFDKVLGLPTSIKTTKNNTICLADACRVFSIDKNFRLIVLQYVQNGTSKIPSKFFEFFPTKEEWDSIKGNLPLIEVKTFHDKIKEFKLGFHVEARQKSKEIKNDLTKRFNSFITLNPKIDSKDQRRLQASITLSILLDKIKQKKIIETKNGFIQFNGIAIGAVESPPRKFLKDKITIAIPNLSKEDFKVGEIKMDSFVIKPFMPIPKCNQISLF